MDAMDRVPKRQRVLVVDDEPQVVFVLELALGSEGYDVCTARNGVEAMAQISAKHPQLMVLDVMMPRMDGWSVMRELAKLPAEERPRVVMVTALASGSDRATAAELGVDAYVTKPFDMDELLGVIHGLQKAS
ncbi:MAG: response regulator transcription factor [Actinobacteria bacterium]|nr:MAG: response regulator transcription factor [Actinomycetota bacterium]